MVFIDFLGKPFLRGAQFLWAFVVVGLLVVVGGCCFGFGCCCLAVAGFCWFVMVLGGGMGRFACVVGADLLFVVFALRGLCGLGGCLWCLWLVFVCISVVGDALFGLFVGTGLGFGCCWFVWWCSCLFWVVVACVVVWPGHCWLVVFACYFGWLR